MHYVYILKCADKTLYTGSTNDIDKRLRQHNGAKAGAHYTKTRRPVVLIHVERYRTLARARAREAAIKRLDRAQKLMLIQLKDMGKGNNAYRKDKKKPKKPKGK